MCRTKYLDTPCKKNIGEGWFQMTNDRCVKAFYNTQHLGHSDAEVIKHTHQTTDSTDLILFRQSLAKDVRKEDLRKLIFSKM